MKVVKQVPYEVNRTPLCCKWYCESTTALLCLANVKQSFTGISVGDFLQLLRISYILSFLLMLSSLLIDDVRKETNFRLKKCLLKTLHM